MVLCLVYAINPIAQHFTLLFVSLKRNNEMWMKYVSLSTIFFCVCVCVMFLFFRFAFRAFCFVLFKLLQLRIWSFHILRQLIRRMCRGCVVDVSLCLFGMDAIGVDFFFSFYFCWFGFVHIRWTFINLKMKLLTTEDRRQLRFLAQIRNNSFKSISFHILFLFFSYFYRWKYVEEWTWSNINRVYYP